VITEFNVFPNPRDTDTPLTHFLIVSTALSQIRYKNCRVIVDNRSRTNAVFFEVFENDGLKSLPHSHPFKITWFKPTTIRVPQTCLVLIDFHLYLWRIMWHMLGTKLKLSSAFQLIIDCQTEIVHKSALSSFASHMHVESHHDLHKKVMDKIA